jgi:hypothetical protein
VSSLAVEHGVRPGGGEQREELAGRYDDKAPDYELAVVVADLPELLPDPAVVHEHSGNIGEPAELIPHEANHLQDLEEADDPKQ